MQLITPSIMMEKEILAFKQAFLERKLLLHGANELDKFSNVADWFDYLNAPVGTNLFGYEKVAGDTFLLFDREEIVGVISLRYMLTPVLLEWGGHIGYSVVPTHWGKGYATEMLKLGLIEMKKVGIKRVLVTCDKNNVASAKVITKNGGQLENEIEYQNRYSGGIDIIQRYWIKIE